MSSARICISTTPAGTRCCATAAGCRPSRTRNTSSTRANTQHWEAIDRARRTPPGMRRLPGNSWSYNCRADRRGRPGAAGRRRLSARRQFYADPDARPFALPLLRHDPLAGPAGGRHRRPDAPRAAMPRAGLVDHLRLRPGAGRAVAPALPGPGRRHGHVRAADPFSASDRGLVSADGDRFRYMFVR